jgi:hypothetical protein
MRKTALAALVAVLACASAMGAVDGAVDAQAVFGDLLQELDAYFDKALTEPKFMFEHYHPPANPPAGATALIEAGEGDKEASLEDVGFSDGELFRFQATLQKFVAKKGGSPTPPDREGRG